MPGRAASLGDAVEERFREVHRRLSLLGDTDLARPRGGEGWTAGLVFLHIALGLRRQAGWLERARDGRVPFRFDWDVTHRLNARVARDHPRPGRAQIEECLALGEARLRRVLARIGDDDLQREALLVGERRVSSAVVLSRIVLRHIDDHLATLDVE